MRLRFLPALLLAACFILSSPAIASDVRFEISYPAGLDQGPITGRLFLTVSKNNRSEPRLQAGSYTNSVPLFGIEVNAWKPGDVVVIDSSVPGFPVENLSRLPAGDYFVQAVLNVYTQVHRKDGASYWVHLDQWEGQQFNRSPGNLISAVHQLHIDPLAGFQFKMPLVRKIPPVPLPADTEWVKHVKIESRLLTEFWGFPVYLGATVLLPRGYHDAFDQKYPAVYVQGHFGLTPPFGFTTEPPVRPETPAQRQARLKNSARETGFEFAQSWMSENFPRMIAITFQHPTPFYDDSYAVNSANNGPYADALLTELIPFLESKYHLLPDAKARVLTGGSTGGWEALALQLYYPTFFNGTWSLYPDPVDFTRYQLSNIYEDENAFEVQSGDWNRLVRPLSRNPDGQVTLTMRDMSRLEAVLGGVRSGQQLAAWEAAWGPMGNDGLPRPLWDRATGKIDREVAFYMRDHGYDLRYYLATNWGVVGQDLVGKINIYCGDMDNYYLNLGVYKLEEFLRIADNPKPRAVIEYGRPMKPHGWQPFTNAELLRKMAARINETAPGMVTFK